MSSKYDLESIELPVTWKRLKPIFFAAGLILLAGGAFLSLFARGADGSTY